MIKELHVTSFAIIDDITINFDNNMTALTGQTGAGKSLIIDCISLLLGARADLDMIRYQESKATIEGIFDFKNDKINDILNKYGIPILDTLTIKREISQRSKILINGLNVTLNQLKEISFYLADIHVQNDTLKLVNPDNYINIIDSFDKSVDDYFNNYQIDLIAYKEVYKEYKSINEKNDEIYEKLDLLKFQYDELTKLDLKENELDDVTKEINVLLNYDRIFNSLNDAYNYLDGIDNIYDSFQSLKKIKEYNTDYEKYASDMENSYYVLDDIKAEIKKEINGLDFSKEYLDELQEREAELKKCEKKYKMSINELINYIDKIKKEIDKCENYDEYVKDIYDNLVKKHKKLVDSAVRLQKERERIAAKLSESLINECKELDLENINFKIEFSKPDLSDPLNNLAFQENGIALCDFLISLNKGEPVKPLSKVASGGELSRIMLGFKSILASKQNLSLIVFDEIDSGISGVMASKIAKKIKNISKSVQVLCITHLPHVASIADNQLFISKYEIGGRTLTKVEKLDYDSRIKQIAIMISGDKLTPNAINNAKELLTA